MVQIQEIISFIESLSETDFKKLRNWFVGRDMERWDRQIESDSSNGKLDFLVDEALKERDEGRLREL